MFKMTKQEKSWVFYDFANSAYATIMIAAIFPIYFTEIADAAEQSGDFWWGVGSAIAAAVLAIIGPVIGTIADYKGMKKKLFTSFLVIGLAFSLLGAFSDLWQLLLLAYVMSNIGFLGANLINDSLLTDVTTKDRMDTVSSWGYALGYIGGSTIPFLMCIALIMFGGNFGIDSILASKISVVIMTAWWAIFSIPILKNVKQVHGIDKPTENAVKQTLAWVLETAKKIIRNKAMVFFMLAYFFYIDGVNTVINMSTTYGAALGLDSTGMILALLVTQFVAFPCSVIFAKLSKKIGSIKMLKYAVGVYLLICSLGFVMGFGLEEGFLTKDQSLILFWLLAFMVGTVQGGIQAISRSTFAKLVPPENSGEYFGFFDIFGKFAAVIGPALYAFIVAATGKSYVAIFSLVILFIIALVLLAVGRNHLKIIDENNT